MQKSIQQYTQTNKMQNMNNHIKQIQQYTQRKHDRYKNTTVNTNKCNVHIDKQNAKHKQPHITTDFNAIQQSTQTNQKMQQYTQTNNKIKNTTHKQKNNNRHSKKIKTDVTHTERNKNKQMQHINKTKTNKYNTKQKCNNVTT